MDQGGGGGQAAHAGADHDHVAHAGALDGAGRHPILGGQFQPLQVLAQARFQGGEAGGRGRHAAAP